MLPATVFSVSAKRRAGIPESIIINEFFFNKAVGWLSQLPLNRAISLIIEIRSNKFVKNSLYLP